jgi:DNA polymerase III alpha subunit
MGDMDSVNQKINFEELEENERKLNEKREARAAFKPTNNAFEKNELRIHENKFLQTSDYLISCRGKTIGYSLKNHEHNEHNQIIHKGSCILPTHHFLVLRPRSASLQDIEYLHFVLDMYVEHVLSVEKNNKNILSKGDIESREIKMIYNQVKQEEFVKILKGLKEEDMQVLIAARDSGFSRIAQLLDAGVPLSALECLADADAFRSIGLDRRKALWEIASLSDHLTGLFSGLQADNTGEKTIELPEMTLAEHVIEDYRTVSLSLKAHPVSFARDKLLLLKVITTTELAKCDNGMFVRVAGLVLVRPRPGTASGICFITIEDETGTANLVVFKKLFHQYRKEIVHCRLLMVDGKVQKEGEVIHIVVRKCYDLSALLLPVANSEARGSEDQSINHRSTSPGVKKADKAAQGDIFHSGRNFH